MDSPSQLVTAHPAGARRVIPEPRRRWLAGGAFAGGWQTSGAALQPEFHLRQPWIAAPVQVEPLRPERLRVVDGRLGVTIGRERRVYRSGDVVELPAGRHATLWNAGVGTVRLVDDFSPPLRRARWLDETFPVHVAPPSKRRVVASIAAAGAVATIAGVALRAWRRRD
jgi:hypothetical protein